MLSPNYLLCRCFFWLLVALLDTCSVDRNCDYISLKMRGDKYRMWNIGMA